MKPGTYTVNVRFLVEKNGRITDVKALNDPGYNLALGAERTIRTGPKWKAGQIGGRKVRSYHTQPIIFMISSQ
jgi:protein TonB